MGIIVALIALSVLIFVHELGHFMAAKAVGIKVIEFAMFMGPKLFSFKKGETEYSLRLIPMGGFCRMEGEGESSDDPRAFSNQAVWRRFLVIAAGPALNILTAFVFASIVLSVSGFHTGKIAGFTENSPLKAAGIEAGDRLISYDGRRIHDPDSDLVIFMHAEDGSAKEVVYFDASQNKKVKTAVAPSRTETRYRLGFTAKVIDNVATNIIGIIEPDSPLNKAGLKNGDKIIKLDDTEVHNTADIQNYLNKTREDKTAPIRITIERNGKVLPPFEDIKPFPDYQYTLGVNFEYKKGNIFEVAGAAFRYSLSTIRNVLITLKWLFTGVISVKELSGPVGIIGTVGTVVETQKTIGDIMLNLLYVSAFISINLGVMNLIPFPALDGSMLLILLIEKIRGKPIQQEKIGIISFIGLILLFGVLIFTLFNDIPRWF